MGKIGSIVQKEFREALPAVIFFLFLFHILALTRAVSIGDYSMGALRATTATVSALIVAKAILIVEALPIGKASSGSLAAQATWKALLFTAVALLFHLLEETIPLALKHGSLRAGAEALGRETSWQLWGVQALWTLVGMLVYCTATELVRVLGPERVKELLFGTRKERRL